MNLSNYNPLKDRYHLTLHLKISLESPLSHIGEVMGNQSNLRTMAITDLSGRSSEVFAYSGNALRNKILRRCGIDSFLESIGTRVNPIAHQALFAGGFIDGGTGNDLELDRKLRQLIPPISVLGTAKPRGLFGSKDAQMIPGRINIGDATLVCLESAGYCFRSFPPVIPIDCLDGIESIVSAKKSLDRSRVDNWLGIAPDSEMEEARITYSESINYHLPYLEKNLRSYTEWLTWNQKTRRDSLQDPQLQSHLVGTKPIEGSIQLSLLGEDKKEEKAKEKPKTQQMIMGDWLLQKGAILYSRWDAEITSIEEGFLVDALLAFNRSPYLGGKCATGCGLVSLEFWYESEKEKSEWLRLAPSLQVESDRAKENHARYLEYLSAYQDFLASAKESNEVRGLFDVD
jgi:hypothetical protein